MIPRLRSAALLAVAAGAILGIGWGTNRAYPIAEWLLLRVLGYWGLTLYWGLGCLAAGVAVVERVAPRRYRTAEIAAIGFPLGVLLFAILVFGAGLLGRLHVLFFAAAPAGMLAAGYPAFARVSRRLASTLRGLSSWRPTPVELASLVFGAVGILLTYLPILTPHNIQHDARWYHLPVAQQFASTGHVAAFPEGWFLGAYPHLASFLYAWAFLLPAGVVHRLALAAHVEFLIVLVTLLTTPVVLRRVLPGVRLPTAWSGFFLFPCFLVYDSNVSMGADHVAALWAPALLLVLYRALNTFEIEDCILVGALAAGAALTKYSALSVVAPALGAVLLRAFLRGRVRGFGPRTIRGPLAMMAAFLAAWSPHWLANYVWYGDPVYPHMSGSYFHAHPWDAQAELYVRIFMEYAVLHPTRDLAGVLETIWNVLTLGFRITEVFGYRGELPLFGFLFAATLYCLPFAGVSRRVWIVEGLSFAAAAIWYWTNHRDRYLQACLPWLVVATLSVLLTLWRSGRLGRAVALALVGTELVVGAGLFLVPLHVMMPGKHPLPLVVDLVAAGYEKHYAERFQPYDEWNFSHWVDLGQRLPPKARVLVHEDRLWVGLGAPVVSDEAQWQAGIRYLDLSTPAAVYDEIARYSVTHVVTGQSHPDGGGHGIAGDLSFWNFVVSYGRRVETKGHLTLWEMPAERPPAEVPGAVVAATCNQSLAPGIYPFAGLLLGRPSAEIPASKVVPPELLSRADFAVVEKSCGFQVDAAALEPFRKMTDRRGVSYYRRLSPLGAGPTLAAPAAPPAPPTPAPSAAP